MNWYKEYSTRKSFNSRPDMSDAYEEQIREFMNDLKYASKVN